MGTILIMCFIGEGESFRAGVHVCVPASCELCGASLVMIETNSAVILILSLVGLLLLAVQLLTC